eukprot:COSAG01_NODE_229_length_21089_cov_575.019194_26_plen_78_part_00
MPDLRAVGGALVHQRRPALRVARRSRIITIRTHDTTSGSVGDSQPVEIVVSSICEWLREGTHLRPLCELRATTAQKR